MPGWTVAVPPWPSRSALIETNLFRYFEKSTMMESLIAPPDMSVPPERAVSDTFSSARLLAAAHFTSAFKSATFLGQTTTSGRTSKTEASRLYLASVAVSSRTSPLKKDFISSACICADYTLLSENDGLLAGKIYERGRFAGSAAAVHIELDVRAEEFLRLFDCARGPLPLPIGAR